MSFFDELPLRAKGMAGKMGERAKGAVDSAKIAAAIAAEQREINKNYQAVGQWYVCEYPGEAPEAIRDVVAAIRASQEKISELQASRERAESAEAETAVEAEGAVCPVCGKISSFKFCPQCGAPMGL